MKQLGNLAIICAKRSDLLFQINNSKVSIEVGASNNRETLSADWRNEEKINEFIMELNHGKLTEKNIKEKMRHEY